MSAFTKVGFMLSLLLISVAAGSQDSCPDKHLQQDPVLLQKNLQIAKVADGPVSIDHANIVCHSQSCKEAQAKLTSIENEMTVASQKLQKCATSRGKLKKDLGEVLTKRSEVEAALKECVATRATLQMAIEECAERRAEKTAALEECKSSRAALEAKLRQCVEVDRPQAEKDLAACTKERAELQKLLEKLQGDSSGSSGGKGSRKSKKSSSSLLQTDMETREGSDSSVEAEVSRIKLRLQELEGTEGLIVVKIEKLVKLIATLAEQLEVNDAEFDTLAATLMEQLDKEKDLMVEFEGNEMKLVQSAKDYTETISGPLQNVRDQLAIAQEEEGKSLEDLASVVLSQAQGTSNLLQLKVQFYEAQYEKAKATQEWQHSEVSRIKALLEEGIKKGAAEECEGLRAELVTAEMSLQGTTALLNECLTTKAELTQKIEKAEVATSIAQKALEDCISAKASMQKELSDCNAKCAALSKDLQECLSAKEELKSAIEECHSHRDAARAALKECLAAKDKLKSQISALKAGALLQRDKFEAVINHSESMGDLLQVLKTLAAKLIGLASQQAESSHATKKAVSGMSKLLNIEANMEKVAAAAAADGADLSSNPLGAGLATVQAAISNMLAAVAAANAENDDVLGDITE